MQLTAAHLPSKEETETSNLGTLPQVPGSHSMTAVGKKASGSRDSDFGKRASWGTDQEETSGPRCGERGRLAAAGLTCRRKESSSMLGFSRKKFWRSRSRALTVFPYSAWRRRVSGCGSRPPCPEPLLLPSG